MQAGVNNIGLYFFIYKTFEYKFEKKEYIKYMFSYFSYNTVHNLLKT